MSGRLEKATRRDLRRAMGEDAAKTVVEHQSMIGVALIRLQGLREDVDRNRTNLATAFDDHADLRRDLRNFVGRTFWQRVKWLLRGEPV